MFLNVYSAGKDMEKKPKNVFMWIFENKLFSRLLILWHKTICWDYPAIMLEW